MSDFQQVQSFPGSISPLGLSQRGSDWNLAVYSKSAESVSVALFSPEKSEPDLLLAMTCSDDAYWSIRLRNIPSNALYALSVIAKATPEKKTSTRWLSDPFAKILDASPEWGKSHFMAPVRSPFIISKEFDWKNSRRPQIAPNELIIYEMHVRGFTIHPSAQCSKPGTYRAMIEKIPYLKKLGVNAVELMPIYEFDETSSRSVHPVTGQHLLNYWGYQPISFFSPKRSFASNPILGEAVTEFKELVRALHENGIEVILDVVYNHTGEGKEEEKPLCWRGIDHGTYYMLDSNSHDLNFTGCGNTINANNPIVQQLILESLRFWATEMQVDGFRFDLASILTRGPDSHPMAHPPLIEAISKDPQLSHLKLIAEAWDAAGLYQLGAFAKWGPWSEWNGRFRDITRRFMKGTNGKAGLFASVLSGSQFLYHTTPTSSVNFITAHDGFCLRDLVSFQHKRNLDNGEENRDGANDNDNWNCGVEGITQDVHIELLRERQMRNFLLALFLSQGIPMLLMGDEYGHTRRGNNNPYVQDNELNWFLWDECEKNIHIVNFVSDLIAFRKHHSELRLTTPPNPQDIQWHGKNPNAPDWSYDSRLVALSVGAIYVCFNAHPVPIEITLPRNDYHLVLNTEKNWKDNYLKTDGPIVEQVVTLAPYSAILLSLKTSLSGMQ